MTTLLALSCLATVRHAFVFRHCVRSTSVHVKHVYERFTHPRNYSAVPLPEWNTPTMWCTAGGMDVMIGTGAWMRTLLGDDASISVVSDTVQRDADTSLALLSGFCGSRLPECAAVRYDPLLFEAARHPELGIAPMCSSPWTDEQQREAVVARVASVAQPADMRASLALLEELVGVGAAGPLTQLPNASVTAGGDLAGAPVVLKALSQALFYAFASGVPHATPGGIATTSVATLTP